MLIKIKQLAQKTHKGHPHNPLVELAMIKRPRKCDAWRRHNRNSLFFLMFLVFFVLAPDTHARPAQEVQIGLLAKRGSTIDVQLWTATAE